MTSPDVQLDTYVDVAVSVVSQGRRYRESQSPTSLYPRTDLEVKNPDCLASEWRNRIQPWLVQHPNGGKPFEKCENLKDFEFSTFFLQYPIAAMHLWNVIQEFYELDRVVCGTSKNSEEKIVEWESMGIFEYLKARKVESKWRNSLQSMRDSTEIKHEGYSRLRPSPDKQNDKANSMDMSMQTESQIGGMQYGVDTLVEAWEALRHIFAENLKGSTTAKIAESMLSEIALAAERRFLMVDNSLKFDRSACEIGRTRPPASEKEFDKSIESEYRNTFKPLRRTNSIKQYAIVVMASTKEAKRRSEQFS